MRASRAGRAVPGCACASGLARSWAEVVLARGGLGFGGLRASGLLSRDGQPLVASSPACRRLGRIPVLPPQLGRLSRDGQPLAGFSSACRRPSYFSLLVQREVAQRNDTPVQRSPGILPCESVRSGRAFRRGSCPGEKGSASLPSPLRACSSEPHRRTRALAEQRASCAHFLEELKQSSKATPTSIQAQAQAEILTQALASTTTTTRTPSTLISELRLILTLKPESKTEPEKTHAALLHRRVAAPQVRAGSALLCPGPLGGGEARPSRPRQGDSAGRRVLFAGAGAPSKSPGEPRGPAGQDAQRAPPRGVVSLGYFSLDKQREVVRPPAGGRNPGQFAKVARTAAAARCLSNPAAAEQEPADARNQSLPARLAKPAAAPRAPSQLAKALLSKAFLRTSLAPHSSPRHD